MDCTRDDDSEGNTSKCEPIRKPCNLVKKKDSGWRFCADYHALNQVIVLHKFPTLTIDELVGLLYSVN